MNNPQITTATVSSPVPDEVARLRRVIESQAEALNYWRHQYEAAHNADVAHLLALRTVWEAITSMRIALPMTQMSADERVSWDRWIQEAEKAIAL